jgi:hypothetical protein
MLFLSRRSPFEVSLWKASSCSISTRLRILTIRVFDLGHAGAFAYAGSLATFVPGYLYVRGTIDVTRAYDQYNVDVANCAGAVPN